MARRLPPILSDDGPPPPRELLPQGQRIYAVGDIHGRHDLLTATLAAIMADLGAHPSPAPTVIFLGDYVSRGPDSREVIETVRTWNPHGVDVVTLKGNHEDLLLGFLAGDPAMATEWFAQGGREALGSYGVTPEPSGGNLAQLRHDFSVALPDAHHHFLERLVAHHQVGGYRFVHAGVAPGVPLDGQRDHDQMWVRGPFLDCLEDFGAVIVHGHSIAAEPQFRRNRIGIDTGAYRSDRLTCLVIDETGYALLVP